MWARAREKTPLEFTAIFGFPRDETRNADNNVALICRYTRSRNVAMRASPRAGELFFTLTVCP